MITARGFGSINGQLVTGIEYLDEEALAREKCINKYKGICLDIGCSVFKQKGFVGLDKEELPGVDIVHDLEVFPYPLEDESCLNIVGSHIYEHIKPWLSIQFMDELWRIMKPDGKLALSMPYGVNETYVSDPTHCNPSNHTTWNYFDPSRSMYGIYRPKPWKLEPGFPVWQITGYMEVLMRKLTIEEAKKISDESNKQEHK